MSNSTLQDYFACHRHVHSQQPSEHSTPPQRRLSQRGPRAGQAPNSTRHDTHRPRDETNTRLHQQPNTSKPGGRSVCLICPLPAPSPPRPQTEVKRTASTLSPEESTRKGTLEATSSRGRVNNRARSNVLIPRTRSSVTPTVAIPYTKGCDGKQPPIPKGGHALLRQHTHGPDQNPARGLHHKAQRGRRQTQPKVSYMFQLIYIYVQRSKPWPYNPVKGYRQKGERRTWTQTAPK